MEHRQRKTLKLLVFLAVFIFLLMLYCIYSLRYKRVFFPNTVINGIDVSGLDAKAAEQCIFLEVEDYILTLGDGEQIQEHIAGRDIGIFAYAREDLEKIIQSQNPYLWPAHMVKGARSEIQVHVAFDERRLAQAVQKMSYTEPGSEEDLLDAVKGAVQRLETDLPLQDRAGYLTYDRYADMTVTYQFGDKTEILDGTQIRGWIMGSEDGNILFDDGAILGYVKELADTYDTAYTSRMFTTSHGTEICISQGHYGWQIDQEGEARALKDILLSGRSQVREPLYSQTAASHGERDYGDTYVELDITAQHLWLYKKGTLLLETDFVSGDLSRGYGTPDGIYPITYKERNATLSGKNYSVPAEYWMPFNQDIGLHDAPYRAEFGGSIYKINGSHGCVNLPPDAAGTIFENVSEGTAVICYTTDGG